MINKDIKIIALMGFLGTIVATVVTLFFNVVCSVVTFLLGAILTLTFYIVTKKRYKKIADLNNYLSLVCAGNYMIDINDNTEGELSILKNNLYKVIVLLRSKNELLEKDKIYLADSLADISHQLKTPLTSLMVMVDLLKDEKNIDKQKQFISIIEIQISKIKWLVENLLKLSKLDAGTIKFKKEQIDVLSVITKSLSPFLVQMEMKNISLETTINDFSFTGDLNWTSEAVENIIKNCIEHTDDNGKLNIETGVTNIYSYIKITDNGCGIKKKDLPHIFERFYQGENSSKESVGIGLALAKTIIDNQGGSIEVTSEENVGTEFIIKFNKMVV
nr:HAMP domain-containing sensor histidine kinase [uncultured Ruminococcus sp.]